MILVGKRCCKACWIPVVSRGKATVRFCFGFRAAFALHLLRDGGNHATAAPHTLVINNIYLDRTDAYRVWHRKVVIAIPCHIPRRVKTTGRAMSMR
jgi:hypothetical protein